MTSSALITCRLCGASSAKIFNKLVLARHDVAYFRCVDCQSIQTEVPYWLDEAYAIPGVHIDVGGASRTIKNWSGLSVLLGRLGFSRTDFALDFGAASGLLGRLMRDIGYNFHSYDKYARPSFTSYFNAASCDAEPPKLITAFEVFEHLPEPKVELSQLFALRSPLIVFTTWFCDDQNGDWIYYIPECGQHVFFYSETAMRNYAAQYGYELRSSAFFHILSRPDAFSVEQRQVIHDFTLHGATWAHQENADLLAGVCMGNGYIDADFNAARVRFQREREDART
jgi:Methyltransferase domain